MSGRGRRDERQEDRQEFGSGGSATQYKMRQKLVSIGDDFWIENNGASGFSRWTAICCACATR